MTHDPTTAEARAALTVDERKDMGCFCWHLGDVGKHRYDCPVPAVERILAARLAPASGLAAAVEALAADLWRVAPCGCGHRADLHVGGTMEAAVCTGGLGLCGCEWSYTRIIQTRLRALLADSAPVPDQQAVAAGEGERDG